jgi:MFS family permease
MGVLMAMGILATIVGPNIGGYVVQNFGWRYIFYINIPTGVLAILLAFLVSESYGQTKHHIDILGSILIGSALTAGLLGVVRLESLPFTDITVFPLFAASVILIILLLVFERRSPEPILDLQLLARGDVLALNLAMLVTFAGMTCIAMFVPTFAQLVLKLGVQDSGTLLTPYTGTMLVMAIIGGILIDKLGTKPLMLIGLIISGLAFYGLMNYATDAISLAILLVIAALGWGVVSNAFQVSMMAMTPKTQKGSSSAILNTFKGIGGMITPLMGGYYLTNATNKVYSMSQAFNNIFMTAAFLLIIGAALMVYIIIRSKPDKPKLEVKATLSNKQIP